MAVLVAGEFGALEELREERDGGVDVCFLGWKGEWMLSTTAR